VKPIDVEPLDEQRWKKVEHGVFRALDEDAAKARARPVRGWTLGFAGAALAAGLSVLGYAVLAPEHPPPAVATSTPPPASGAEERWESGEQPLERTWGTLELRAAPRSLLALEAPRRSLHRGRLESGEVRVAVPPGEQVELALGRVLVRASAVRFVASYDGYRPALAVEEGELVLAGAGVPSVLRAGERWPVADGPLPGAAQAPLRSQPDSPDGPAAAAAPLPHEGAARARNAALAEPHARERYERAARLEGSDPGQAEALYSALARGRGVWSAHALFALGRLELERGQTARGRATLRRYLARHPGGPNAEDARRLLAPQP
jgi:hypothetical protein